MTLVRGLVEVEHLLVDGDLVLRRHALEPRPDHLVDVAHRFQHALAHVPLGVIVPQLDRLAFTSRGAARHRRSTRCSTGEDDFSLDGGIATAVEHFPGVHFNDGGHVVRGVK